MGFQVSPGVNVSEIDLSTVVPSVSTTDGAFVGVFNWGPLEKITLITSELELVDLFKEPDNDTATSFFTAANFLAYGDKLRLVRVANTSTQDFPLTIDNTDATAPFEIIGTGFETALRKGSTIEIDSNPGETYEVLEVVDDNTAIVDAAATTVGASINVTATTYVGALNATSEQSTGNGKPGVGILIKNEDDYEVNHSGGLGDFGLYAAKYPGDLGNSLEISLCPSANAFQQDIANVSATGTALTGSGTLFLSTLEPGSIVIHPVSGEEVKVSSVTDDTNAVLEQAFATDFSTSTVTVKWEFADAIGQAPGTSDYAASRGGSDDELHIVVVDRGGEFTGIQGNVLERFRFLSKAFDAKTNVGDNNYYAEVINRDSKYIYFGDHLPSGLNWGSTVSGTTFTTVDRPNTVKLSGGRNANTGLEIDAARIKGYDLFADPDEVDVALVMAGEASTAVCIHIINNICEVRKDCIAVISPERADVVNNAGDEIDDAIEFRNTLPSSSYAVMDSSWKYQFDKYNVVFRWVPLNGDIAGLMVRTDTNQDPWFSPAGYNRGNIKNVIRLSHNITRAQRDDLYQASINPVISSQGRGTVLFGDKTLLAKPSAFDRINVRRLFIVLEKAIAAASEFALFEFNDEFTRAQFRNLVEPFLRDVQGRRGIIDFRVVADSTNNTPEVIDRNEFIGDIYIKPARSINYIQLNFIAVRTGVEFSEIVGKF